MHGQIVGLVSVLLVLGLIGCRQSGEPAAAALPDPHEAAAQAIEQFDSDQDGALSAAELEKSPGLRVAKARMDADGDGRLSRQEIADYFETYHEINLTLISLEGTVTLDGRPLAGATVTLVPEPFLGAATKPAKTVSDRHGRCQLASEGAKYPGVQLGVYRITVSKIDRQSARELIPSRYNTETELGVEVSNAAADDLKHGLQLRLQSR